MAFFQLRQAVDQVLYYRRTILPLQGFEVIYRIFEISMTLRTWLPDAFHYLVLNNNLHCRMILKNAKFDSFGSEMPDGKSGCE